MSVDQLENVINNDLKGENFNDFIFYCFATLIVICGLVQYLTWSGEKITTTGPFKSFQRGWLAVYLLAMTADWLQGPYVYALYKYYGFDKEQIAHLFIAGFGSSMLFGTFVGSLADKYGRKRMSVAYGCFYGLSCITKLYNSYPLLLFGRILAGIATSLLFSSFESWMVSEHHNRDFAPAWLSQTFSYATFGNGISAIGAGLAASYVADNYGFVAPFMAALSILIVCSLVVLSSWSENYGDSKIDVMGGLQNAVLALQNDTRIPILGFVQSLFEASMYTFVFMWTPVLEDAVNSTQSLPFGQIFACFMVAIMIGSGFFGFLIPRISAEVLAVGNFAIAALSLTVATLFISNPNIVFVCFLMFEVCCGVYFPCQGTLRGKYIPEASRSAIMNFFRIPLNFLVVLVLIKISLFENSSVFAILVVWLLSALCCQVMIVKRRSETQKEIVDDLNSQ